MTRNLTRIYILYDDVYGERKNIEGIRGVFSTVGAAQEYAKYCGYRGEWRRKDGYLPIETVWYLPMADLRIEAFEIDKPVQE